MDKVKLPEVGSTDMIRFSISDLFRINVDGKYLLVKGKRIEQFQPVGGKRFEKSVDFLEGLRARTDKNLPIDDASRDDLRLRVPFDSIKPFIKWYFSERGRETSPWREFYEELVKTNCLPPEKFEYICYEHIDTHLEGIRYSEHFNCHEILIAEIYNLIPKADQFEALKNLKENSNKDLLWCDEELVMSKKFNDAENKTIQISETSIWVL